MSGMTSIVSYLFASSLTEAISLSVQALEAPKEPRKPKVHWDHVLGEMVWLSKVSCYYFSPFTWSKHMILSRNCNESIIFLL
jgi:hypothetical protein